MSNSSAAKTKATPADGGALAAEQSVLGCVLLDNDGTIGGFLRLSEADFVSPAHKTIFNSIRTLLEKNSPADLVTVTEALSSVGKLDQIGGLSYLSTLCETVPSTSAFKHYTGILRRNRILRRLQSAGSFIVEQSRTAEDEQSALAAAEKAIFDISREDERKELTPLSAEMPGVLAKLDTIQRDPTALRGLPTGFAGLDSITNGLQKSDLIIIAARPSVGKTSLSLNIALNCALYAKAKVAIFSLEMSKQSLAMRAICSVAKVSLSKAMRGTLNSSEWAKVFTANKAIADSQVFIDDNSVISPAEITRKCMRLKREHGLDLVMIDYLGLMGSAGSRRESRQVEVSDNSRFIKILAKELDVPVLLLSQLNRGIEARKGADGRPMLSDLRESGAIEQDADIVMFIHKERMDNNTEPSEDRTPSEAPSAPSPIEEVELIIAKHRNGSLGTVKLDWIGEYTTFRSKKYDREAAAAAEALRKKTKTEPAVPTQEVENSTRTQIKPDAVDAMPFTPIASAAEEELPF